MTLPIRDYVASQAVEGAMNKARALRAHALAQVLHCAPGRPAHALRARAATMTADKWERPPAPWPERKPAGTMAEAWSQVLALWAGKADRPGNRRQATVTTATKSRKVAADSTADKPSDDALDQD